jgi:hypothetical protein
MLGLCAWLPITLLLLVGCQHSSEVRRPPSIIPRTSQVPTFDGPEASSFSAPYASSLRNAGVSVQRRQLGELVRRELQNARYPIPQAPRLPPFSLVVSPDGMHGVLTSLNGNDIIAQGSLVWSAGQGDAIAFDECVFLKGEPITWQGTPLPREANVSATAHVRRIDLQRHAAVFEGLSSLGDYVFAPTFGLLGGPRVIGDVSTMWAAGGDGHGIGAIGADFASVLAFNSGLLQVYLSIHNGNNQALLAGERKLDVVAKHVSIIPPLIMLVARDGAGSKLLAFTGNTAPVYSLTVPFEALQPAVAGGGKRVYVAGRGLAALDDGKVTWTHESTEPLYVSSFQDGSPTAPSTSRFRRKSRWLPRPPLPVTAAFGRPPQPRCILLGDATSRGQPDRKHEPVGVEDEGIESMIKRFLVASPALAKEDRVQALLAVLGEALDFREVTVLP